MVFSMDGEGIFALISTTLLITRTIATTMMINFYIVPYFMPDFHIIYSPLRVPLSGFFETDKAKVL